MKLNQKILMAIAVYYIHRSVANRADKPEGYKWNKAEDLDTIAALAAKSNLGFDASAGTFWFRRGKQRRELNESTFPNFKLPDQTPA